MSGRQNKSELFKEFLSLPLEKDEIAFLHLGYSGIVLRLKDKVAAFDIADLLGNDEIDAISRLDLLAYTHSHADHYNRARARRILKQTDAHIVAQKQVAEDLKGRIPSERLTVAQNKKYIEAGGFEVVAINGVHPRPISVFWISKGRFSVFHGGDSGYCPVRNHQAKLAFLPTGFPSPSCTPESALKFTLDLKPHVAVAMHGKPTQMNNFKTLVNKKLPDTTVIIPEKNKTETTSI